MNKVLIPLFGSILLLSACTGGGYRYNDQGFSELPQAETTKIMEVNDGETITLNPGFVRKSVDGKEFAMYAYNGQIPGPTLKVEQGSTFTVQVTDGLYVPTTIHWHGIRLANANDGVPDVTQKAIEPGASFTYTVTVPDEGMFWYHPHVREDLQQDMGLYGNLWVTPKKDNLYNPVNREEVVILDDLLLDGDRPTPYGKEEANFALMGRFGNTMLINGQERYALSVARGSVVRFYLTNAANTRTFNVRFTGARMKLVGGDVGRTEREEFLESVILSPSERAIIEVFFDKAGTFILEHRTPEKVIALGTIIVTDTVVSPSYATSFIQPTQNSDVIADIKKFRSYVDKPVDKIIHLSVESTMARMMQGGGHGGGHGGSAAKPENDEEIEWEDPMPHQNSMSTKHNTKWKFIDEASAAENMDIAYNVKVGDKVKIRLVNDEETDGSDHPMQHPIHFHGQRFLVLSVNGEKNENFVWKDTVLVPKDAIVDILLDVTNPGDWMFHCHIAEHISNGMMGMLKVKGEN
ncbi:multicopper oxidase family protein [Candidatus Peregrinibacteria bacterium]|nr:multicopper oxidase family protein [Candidatus Peregrinibacteria bacterium]